MKTFKSTDLRRKSAEVFKSAIEDGAVCIKHDGYKDKMITLRVEQNDSVSEFVEFRRESDNTGHPVYHPYIDGEFCGYVDMSGRYAIPPMRWGKITEDNTDEPG